MQLRDASPLALAARRVKVGLLGARRLATWIVEPIIADVNCGTVDSVARPVNVH